MTWTWTDGPATWKQLRDLREHGYTPDHPLTKSEAANLIRSFGGQAESQPALLQKDTEPSHKGAGQFRATVENAKSQVEQSGPDKLVESRRELEEAKSRRQEFWINACRESTQAGAGSVQARELYRKHGC